MVKKKQTEPRNDSSTDSDSSEDLSVNVSCPHIKKSVDTKKLRKHLRTNGLVTECAQCNKQNASSPSKAVGEALGYGSDFEYDNTLWLCLKCGTQLCGRARNQHALQHFKTPHSDSHALTMNTRSYEIWCYECDNEVNADSRKNLVECVEFIKKMVTRQPTPNFVIPTANGLENASALNNVGDKILTTWQSMRPLVSAVNSNNENQSNSLNSPVPPPLPPPLPPIPGSARRINDMSGGATGSASSFSGYTKFPALNTSATSLLNTFNKNTDVFSLPRVRGLTNLGNTCFFNAVMQCLAQTPYLLEVLRESAQPGEEFQLPGGTFKFKDNEDVELPMIKGTLSSWGGLTSALAQALEELQSGGSVFTPSKLFDKLCSKCPQFRGGDQHDSHELLRHLLESVRSEDLKRYQRVILQNLGYKDQDINSVSEDMKQKCKIYGNQAADRILRPEQVFRGFLVSTLTCQDCFNVSSRHEYFLDMSLPVSVEKPQPPQRRKPSPENSPVATNTSFYMEILPPKKTLSKKEARKERKAAAKAALEASKKANKNSEDAGSNTTSGVSSCATQEEALAFSSSASSAEQSDADVEDNLVDDNTGHSSRLPMYGPVMCDANGNNTLPSPTCTEKRGDSPENMEKDSLDEDENDSGIATSPANVVASSFATTSETNKSDVSPHRDASNAAVVAVGLSQKGADLIRQISLSETTTTTTPTPNTIITNGDAKTSDEGEMNTSIDKLQITHEQKSGRMKSKRVRTQSHSDWSTTIAPRYQCEDGECSVQSCLNNFTAVELMTGNNKVGCDNCTKRINGDDPKAKTIYTNATKQFLVSSPPAVLILHLKRFQIGPRCVFRKLTRTVTFAMILDIAPFCGSKVKNLPNIDRKQKKLLYSLYGVVEHSGGMYGGHYTAYVKVRPKLEPDDKRWQFIPQGSKAELDQDDEQRKKLDELLAKEKARELRMKAANDSDDFSNSSTSSSSSDHESINGDAKLGAVGGDESACDIEVPCGKWYYVSDSRVQEVSEETVLTAQAYLLFYERIY